MINFQKKQTRVKVGCLLPGNGGTWEWNVRLHGDTEEVWGRGRWLSPRLMRPAQVHTQNSLSNGVLSK